MPGSLGEPHSLCLGPSVTVALRVGCPGYVTSWQVSAEAPAPGSPTSRPGQVDLGFLSRVLCARGTFLFPASVIRLPYTLAWPLFSSFVSQGLEDGSGIW